MAPEVSGNPEASGNGWALHFGGPDKPERRLRDLLAERIDRQPAGAEIDWATYYFRDVDLAGRLTAASDRGVKVTLALESEPRRKSANDEVLALLTTHGLAGGFRARASRDGLTGKLAGHLHTKIYAFSHPRPSALIGSFNPSGNTPEDAEVVAEIGDQDRGHNLLLQLDDATLVAGLQLQVRRIAEDDGAARRRFYPRQNTPLRGRIGEIFHYPRIAPNLVPKALRSLPSSARLWGAISHLKARGLGRDLQTLAQRGATVSLIVHDTERRVPEALVTSLNAAGAQTTRYRHPDALPMHAKFILIEAGEDRTSWLGSYNHNAKSAWLNDEILFRADDPALFRALRHRFDEISSEARGFAAAAGTDD
jgi:phosphatidylserine/phosphatidylglycerophosphate/cardiolipin synthase-like enzyme